MKKGKSYIWLCDKDVKHPIVRKLHEMGFTDIEIVYASHWSANCGWELISYRHNTKPYIRINSLLGFSKKSAIEYLNAYDENEKSKCRIIR